MTSVVFGAHLVCEFKGAGLFLCHDCGIVHVEEWLTTYPCNPRRVRDAICPDARFGEVARQIWPASRPRYEVAARQE